MNEFFSAEHRAEIDKIERLWQGLHDLADMAKEYGIEDMLQDNGVKVLQQLVYLNMEFLPGREGNDSRTKSGIEWEMKSANESLVSGFSTNHHTTHDIIAKYRQVPWSFAIYQGIRLVEIYVMRSEQLEPLFHAWEEKLHTKEHLNNPKIPIKFVRQNGTRIFPYGENPVDPDDVVCGRA